MVFPPPSRSLSFFPSHSLSLPLSSRLSYLAFIFFADFFKTRKRNQREYAFSDEENGNFERDISDPSITISFGEFSESDDFDTIGYEFE
jgi:hypothetical protein